MAIKRFNDYEKTQAYGDFQQLPKGGYVLKILGVELNENSIGQYVKISCDVAEGDYKGFFANDYKTQQSEDKKWHCNYLLNVPNDDGSQQDGWTKRRFKTFTEALEESNSGYHFDWDEQKFKGKLVGGLFNEREYEKNDGSIGRFINLAQFCSVEKIRSGKFKVPDDKLLSGSKQQKPQTDSDGFMSVPEGVEDELPF